MSTTMDAARMSLAGEAGPPLAITRPFIRLAGFFGCLDLVSTMTASGLFKAMLGEWYVVLTPPFFVTVIALLHYCLAPTRLPRKLMVSAALFASLGFYEYFATGAVGGFQDQARWQLIFGFVYPAVLLLFISGQSDEKQLLFWRWFFIGLVAYLATGFALLVKDGVFWAYASTSGLGTAVLSIRYNFANSLFSLIMGNANKTSNYLLLGLMVGPIVLRLQSNWESAAKPTFEQTLFRVYAVLAVMMMTVMFSRIILMLLPIPIYLNRKFLFGSRTSARVSLLLFVGALALAYIRYFEQINFVVQYLLFSSFLGGEAQGVLGTGTGRFQQWGELVDILDTPSKVLLGIGYGSYGALQGCDGCGTHNLFLDHWVASGVFGVMILLGLIGYGALRALLTRYWRMLAAFVVFFTLGMREYSMAYLNVTSMGGLMFLTLFYCQFARPQLKE